MPSKKVAPEHGVNPTDLLLLGNFLFLNLYWAGAVKGFLQKGSEEIPFLPQGYNLFC